MAYQFFREWLSELENLFFPQACAGCGKWDIALCPSCAQAIGGQWSPTVGSVPALHRVIPASELRDRHELAEDSRLPFPVWRLGRYEGVRRKVIISWKNQLSRELTARITAQLRRRGRELAPIFQAAQLECLTLVPAPSRPVRKKEGLFIVEHTAHALCAGLNDGGIMARVNDVLRFEKIVTDRRAKAYAISARLPTSRGIPIVLVDDVLVTGSTLSGCMRALEQKGARVCCAFVLAQQEKAGTKKDKRPQKHRSQP